MRTLARLISLPLLALLISAPAVYAQEDEQEFTQAELDQLLAPIALYPDALLSQILMAATYPLEVVSAARWSRDNPGREGDGAVEAVADKDWDPSVKALAAFPKVLQRMDEDLDWTTRLGDAYLYQESQVMDTVQELRQRAYAAGNLDSPGNLRVIRERDVIVIEPEHPRIVHVPYYNPRLIYGAWWWPAYPPIYWAPPYGIILGTGFFFGSGVHVSLSFFYSTFDWPRHHVVVVHRPHHLHRVPHFKLRAHVKQHGHKWRHKAKHRRGIAYRHHSLQRKHGRSRASGSFHSRKLSLGSLHASGKTRFRHDGLSHTGPRELFHDRMDHRQAFAHSRSRDMKKRRRAHRARRDTVSGFRSGVGSDASRFAGARRPHGKIIANRDIRRSQIHSRRSDARRALSERRRAARHRRKSITQGFHPGRFQARGDDATRAQRFKKRIRRGDRFKHSAAAGSHSKRFFKNRRGGRKSSLGAAISRGHSASRGGFGSGVTGHGPRARKGLGHQMRRGFDRAGPSGRARGMSIGRRAFSRP